MLYVAGLFHDIAKGRGGDHSTLGARDARRFCREHGLSHDDAELVAWLVGDHLVMSSTAQKQDLSDPDVVAAFARRMGTERRLTALYLLTVADIRGTSPKVWNAWKGKLLEDLFHATRARARGDGADADDQRQHRRAAHGGACACCGCTRCPTARRPTLWRHLDTPYFQRHTAEEIAWHARHLYWRVERTEPVVKARLARDGAGLQVLVYLPDQKELFARLCGFFGRAGLSILEAKIHTTRAGYALDTFALNDPAQPGTSYRETLQMVEFELTRVLTEQPPLGPPAEGRIPRQLKHFPLTPEVQIFPDDKGTHYILEVVAGDRPGLLARIAYTLAQGQRERRQREDQHAGRARRGRVPDRRRAAARRAGAAAAGDRAVRAAQDLSLATTRAGAGEIRSPSLRPGDSLRSGAYSSAPASLGKQHVGEPEVAQVADAHRIQDAVQVVAFVLDDARVEAVDVALDAAAGRIEALVAQPREARHDAAEARHRQAAFPAVLHARRPAASAPGLTSSVYGTGSASG